MLHELGMVEQWGSGAQRMIATCKESGLPAPTWEEIGVRLRVTIRADQIAAVSVDPKDQAILEVLGSGDGLGTGEIAAAVGLSSRATRTRLARLVERGLVREIGKGPTDPKRRYIKP